MLRSKKRFLMILAGVLCLTLGLASVAFANPDEATAKANKMNPRVVLAYIAGKANAPLDDLAVLYKEGVTLEEIAETYGIDWAEIEALFARGTKFDKEKVIARLEEAIARLTQNIADLTQKLAEQSARIPEMEARIAKMEDETLKGFAIRHLEILKQRIALGGQHLELMGQRLALLQEELAYAKSR